MAGTVPKQHIASRNRIDVITQVSVGTENNLFIFRKAFHNLLGIGGSNHHIGHRFNGRRGIDIRDHRMIGMRFDKIGKFIGRTTVGQRTACIQIRHQHFFIRTKNLSRFTHKVDTTHHNDIRIRFSCPLCQRQAVTYKVGNILYFARLVIVT